MRRAEVQRKLRQGYLCLCGNRATSFTGNIFTCGDCLRKDNFLRGNDGARDKCGFRGVEEFRCALVTPI